MGKFIKMSLEDWKKLIPRTKKNRRGIENPLRVDGVVRRLAVFRCKNGNPFVDEVASKIRRHIHIPYDKYLVGGKVIWDNLKNARDDTGEADPFLSKTLGKEMLDWIYNESGLMESLDFRTYISFMYDCILYHYCDSSSPLRQYFKDNPDVTPIYRFDTLKEAGMNEENVMEIVIVPLFLECYLREKDRQLAS